MSKVVTFGEIMLRLNPEGCRRFVQADRFEASYAGGEANVAVSLANYGHEAVFVSKVPEHEIGQTAVNELRRYGVDTRWIARGGDRPGPRLDQTAACAYRWKFPGYGQRPAPTPPPTAGGVSSPVRTGSILPA